MRRLFALVTLACWFTFSTSLSALAADAFDDFGINPSRSGKWALSSGWSWLRTAKVMASNPGAVCSGSWKKTLTYRDGLLEARVKLVSTTSGAPASASLLFAWQSAPSLDRYRYVKLTAGAPGTVVLGQKGTIGRTGERVLASKKVRLSKGAWYTVRIYIRPLKGVDVYVGPVGQQPAWVLSSATLPLAAGKAGLLSSYSSSQFDNFVFLDPMGKGCGKCHTASPPAGYELAADTTKYWDGSWWDNDSGLGVPPGYFDGPKGMAADTKGNVYIADCGNRRIQEYWDGGQITLFALPVTSPVGLSSPDDVAVYDNGAGTVFVYVVEGSSHRVQQFNRTGAFLRTWGTQGSGDGQFNGPRGIAVDPAGNVYVTDTLNHRVQKFDASGTHLLSWGTYGSGDGQFNSPVGIEATSAYVYVSDSSGRIQKFGSSLGDYLLTISSPAVAIAVDSTGAVYSLEEANDRVRKYDPDGNLLVTWGTRGSEVGQFTDPEGIAIRVSWGTEEVVVADTGNNRLQRFAPDGSVQGVFGSFGEGASDTTRQQGGHGDKDNLAALGCVGANGCHDLTQSVASHLDGKVRRLNDRTLPFTLADSALPTVNTYHLRREFIKATPVYAWDMQVAFDDFCNNACHAAKQLKKCIDHGVSRPEPEHPPGPDRKIVEMGTHGTTTDITTVAYPLDCDMSSKATVAGKTTFYAPCVSCHDPHGTSSTDTKPLTTANPFLRNIMLRGNVWKSSELCTGCHI